MMHAPYAETLGVVLSDAIADSLAERSAPEVVTAA
jgi:hypothetical protein